MVSLIQLEYIVALDAYRHFVTASEKCFVTQPTLSMQVKKMEEDLGVIIFDRTKQPFIPTEVGTKIIEQARVTLAAAKKIEELVSDYGKAVSGEITLGIIPSLAPYLLPLFIGKFTRKYPDVHVKVVELQTEEIIDHLKKDLLDVGILVTPLSEKGIIEEVLFYEEMLFYVNKNHALAKHKKVRVEELASPDLWLLSSGHCFRSQVINLCSYRANITNDHHFEYASGSLETIKKIVEVEGGFTILPELAADENEDNPKALIKHFDLSKPLREVSFAVTRNYAKKRLLTLLAEEIKTSVPSEMLAKERGQVVEWR